MRIWVYCAFLTRGLLYLATATILWFSNASAVESSQFDAHQSDRDTFSIESISEDRILIRGDFQSVRDNVPPLSLTIPSDVTVTVNLIDGTAVDFRNLRNTLSLGPETFRLPDQCIRLERNWIAEFPLLNIHFEGIERFRPIGGTLSKHSNYYLRSATFELIFSATIWTNESDRPQEALDPIQLLVSTLVLNPTDIVRFRGFPRDFNHESEDNPPSSGAEDFDSIKIVTGGAGVCFLDYQILHDQGLLADPITINQLSLHTDGLNVPFGSDPPGSSTFGPGTRIWFLDPRNQSEQTTENAYFLSLKGARSESGTILDLGILDLEDKEPLRNWDYQSVHYEEEDPNYWKIRGDQGDIDLYWWDFGLGPFHFDFDLNGFLNPQSPDAATSTLIVNLVMDKNVKVFPTLAVNHHDVDLISQNLTAGRRKCVASIPTRILRSRGNRISLESMSSLSCRLDSMDLEIPGSPYRGQPILDLRKGTTHSSSTEVGWVEGTCPSIAGLRLIRIDEDGNPNGFHRFPSLVDNQIYLPLRGSAPGWVLVDLTQSSPPLRTVSVRRPHLRSDCRTQVDQIVIADPKYIPQLRVYLQAIQKTEGVSSRIVIPEEIYDEYSYGEKDYRAIKRYLKDVLAVSPDPKPRYLWLVGESRWDPKNRLGTTVVDEVPSPAWEFEQGWTSNDQWYSYLVGEDSLPDLFVGRASVSTTGELENYLEKALSWRNPSSPGWWRATTLELTDRGFFQSVEDNFERGLSKWVAPKTLDLNEYPLDVLRKFEAIGKVGYEGRGARDDVVKAWNESPAMIEYLGHGGIIVWSKEAMFMGLNRPDSDVDRLEVRDRYPFVFIRSCLSGSVNWPSFPGEVSVSEALIRAKSKGAAAIISAVGTEQQSDQERFAKHFYDGLLNLNQRNLGWLKAYSHSQSILQNERYQSVCNQFILHGDPTLNLDRPETMKDFHFSVHGTQDNPRLIVTCEPHFSGNAQVRIHNVKQTFFESEVFELNQTETKRTFEFQLPRAQNDPLYACLYHWNEDDHRDSFGGQEIVVPERHPEPVSISIENLENHGQPLFATGSLLLRTEWPIPNQRITASISLSSRIDFSEPAGFEISVQGQSVRKTLIRPNDSFVSPIHFQFDSPGEKNLEILLSASDTEKASWTQRFQVPIQIFSTPQLEFSDIENTPAIPVEGESIDLSAHLACVGTVTGSIQSIRAEVTHSGSPHPQIINLWNEDQFVFPVVLSPDEVIPLRWRLGNSFPAGKVHASISIQTSTNFLESTHEFEILNPAEVRAVSLREAKDLFPPGPDEPVVLLGTIENIGDTPSDPMLFTGIDVIRGATFEKQIPQLGPEEQLEIEIQSYSPSSKFQWITTFRPLRHAIKLNTRSGTQKFDVEVRRSIQLHSDESNPLVRWNADSQNEISSFITRFFEPTQAGFRPADSNQLLDITPGELTMLDQSLVFGATEPALAALEHPGSWWMTSNLIQTSPTQTPDPLRFEIPWNEPPVLAKISPKFRLKSPNFLDYPTPYMNLECEGGGFEINYSNTNFEGLFPPKIFEVHPPGLRWSLRNKSGSWPSFAGFLFQPLPEIETPLIQIDNHGPWIVSLDIERIDAPKLDVAYQIKHRTKEGEWSEWESMDQKPIDGNQFLIRFWYDPGGTKAEFVIRSITVQFENEE